MKALEMLTKARANLVLTSPFFASIALRLRLKEDSDCPTAYTDSVVMGYNPEFITGLSQQEVNGLICHEVLHVVMLHCFRRQGRSPLGWNVACDYAINPLVQSAKLVLPQGGLLDNTYANLEAEAIYAMLSTEKEAPDPQSMFGEVRDYQPQTSKEGYQSSPAQQMQDWKINISQALTIAKLQGKLPGGFERIIQEVLEPVLSWQEILSRFITEHSSDDYNWKQPNKRYLYSGLYLPGLNNPSLGTIAVLIDTSGSIRQSELDRFATELKSILSSYPATTIQVVYVDSEVTHTQEVDVHNLELEAKGGGGTDYRPGFTWLEENGINPACVLYFTDGYCSDFPANTDFPTLWIVTAASRFKPPFGEVIRIMGH